MSTKYRISSLRGKMMRTLRNLGICLIFLSIPSFSLAGLAEKVEDPTIELRQLKHTGERITSFVRGDIKKGYLPEHEEPPIRLAYTNVVKRVDILIDKIVADIKENPRLITKKTYNDDISSLNNLIKKYRNEIDIVYARNTRPQHAWVWPAIKGAAIVLAAIASALGIADYLKDRYEDHKFKEALISRLNDAKWTYYYNLPILDRPQKSPCDTINTPLCVDKYL